MRLPQRRKFGIFLDLPAAALKWNEWLFRQENALPLETAWLWNEGRFRVFSDRQSGTTSQARFAIDSATSGFEGFALYNPQ
jgi:hypothetical protein